MTMHDDMSDQDDAGNALEWCEKALADEKALNAQLVEALTDCKIVLCESRRGEDLKTLSDTELGRLWTELEAKVDKALAASK